MAAKITRDVLDCYLKCRYKAHLKLARQEGSPSDYELLTKESKERVRIAATAKLLGQHKESEVLLGSVATRAILKRGVSLLLDVTLEDETFSIRCDALRRATGQSLLGTFHYVPVLFHEAERPTPESRALLEFLGPILGTLQGRQPDWGVLIHGRNCEVKRLRLRPTAPQSRRAIEDAKELQRSNNAPQMVLNSHCQVCEFRQACRAKATAKDDLSLLRAMGEKEIRKYARRGIFTVTQLSCTFRPRKKGERQSQQSQLHHHALQALAIRDKKIYVLGTPELTDCPARIYFDIEGDPDRRFDYLLGMIVEANDTEQRHSFWANTRAEEQRIFEQFLEVIGVYEDFRLYAFGSYEAAFLRRMMNASGRQKLGEKLLPHLVNILSVIHSHIYFPTYSNGLKDIAGYLGFLWTEPDASGVQSIVWRRRWEETGSATLKNMLTTYNMEDCAALRRVTQFVHAICPGQPVCENRDSSQEGHLVSRVEEMAPQSSRREWCQPNFAIPDFEFVNDRAYFDYQRDKVFIRTSKTLKRRSSQERRKKGKKNLRANRIVEITRSECPVCRSTDLIQKQDGRLARLAYDLRITRSGVRRWVTRFTTAWHHCAQCHKRFLPEDYLRLQEHFHSLKSWAMFEHVAHRTSLANLAETIRECFGLPVCAPNVYQFKRTLARYYEDTYKRLLERIVGGALIHADETEIHLKQVGKGYVWIFTNLEEVVFMYRKSREGDFLRDLLKDFSGVLVSDFYTAYDSLDCPQQKCLIHLIRDFNQDIRSNPWDEELKSLASEFGKLLRTAVATIDRYGLKQKHLGKNKRLVERFFAFLAGRPYRSEVAEGYRKRLLKYQAKLFTFLDHDGVPWNNNNAEHAVKQFAYYREYTDGMLVETGLNEYLVLLSIYLTCKYKGVSFLKFLLSGDTDIDAFCENGRRRRAIATSELYPAGAKSSRWSRERMCRRATEPTHQEQPSK
jgi:predicted RecB family nuclease